MAITKPKKSPMAQWVEAAIEHAKIDQSALAKAIESRLMAGFDRSKVNKIVLGKRKVSADEMLAIEQITDFPIPAALRSAVDKQIAKIAQVPLLDSVTAGKLKSPSSQIPVEDVPLLAYADLGRGEFFALTVDGNSMDRISPDGSIIVINRADRTLVGGKPYVFSNRGETTYKIWRPEPTPRFSPYSTDPSHEPIFVKSKKEAEGMVVGRVKRSVIDL